MYPKAIEYYEKSVKLSPANPDVLTDLGRHISTTAIPIRALKDFDRALKVRPNYAQTLFNMGIVKWQGKNDIKGAVATWNSVAADESGLSDKQKVQDLIAQARQQGISISGQLLVVGGHRKLIFI